MKPTHHNAKKVLDTKTGKQYPSAKEAAKQIGCSPEHLRNQLNGNVENKTTMKYHDESGIRTWEMPKEVIDKMGGKKLKIYQTPFTWKGKRIYLDDSNI